MKQEKGFSMIKTMFWLAVIGAGVFYAYMIVPVYNAYWKVEDTFKGVAESMSDKSESEIRARLPDLFHIKYLAHNDVPQEFYDNIKIEADGTGVKISSYYHLTVWLIGPVEGVDPESDYDPKDLKGMDKLRDKLRKDFEFEPYASSF